MGEWLSDAVTVKAPLAIIWNVITDVESYPDWTQGVEEVVLLATTDDGTPHRARFRVDAKVATVTYTLEYRYGEHEVSWQLVEGDTLSQLDGSYVLREQGETTSVTYTLELEIDLPVPGFLKKRAVRSILEQGLTGLKTRAEAQV